MALAGVAFEAENGRRTLACQIRELRGLNYGDYSYIESFPEGGERSMPPVNVPRRRHLFEIWIRTLPTAQAPFALRAALRESRGTPRERAVALRRALDSARQMGAR